MLIIDELANSCSFTLFTLPLSHCLDFLYTSCYLGKLHVLYSVYKRRADKIPPHSAAKIIELSDETIVYIIPYMQDNYAYAIVDLKSSEVAVVDPADPESVQENLGELEKILKQKTGREVTLIWKAVLTTHHHPDHAGGNAKAVKYTPKCEAAAGGMKVYGHSIDKVEACTDYVEHEDVIKLGVNTEIEVLFVPFHTKGHVAYHIKQKAVFTGDTLFVAGVGKFFEGTSEQAFDSLINIIGGLDRNTLIFPGHEYAASNLVFAQWVEPDNHAIQKKIEEVSKLREGNQPVVPSTLKEEKLYNPFLRIHEETILSKTGCRSPSAVIGELRRLKNIGIHLKEKKNKID